MQRVGSNRNPALDLFGAGKHGFKAGDPQTGTPATTPGAEWFNAMQEELVNAIEGLGGTLDAAKRDQLKTVLVTALAGKAAASSLTGLAALAAVQQWTKAQRGAVVALVDAATIAVDLSLSNNFSLPLAGNRTLGTPSNAAPGQSGIIAVTQDATGGRTLAFGAGWKFAAGIAPSLSTTANAVDYLAYYVETANRVFVSRVRDVK